MMKTEFFDIIESTNTYLKNHPDLCDRRAVVAKKQTAGRGRRGRSWISPEGGNVYLSVAFKVDFETEKAPLTGFGAAVAAVEAIEEYCGIACGIKWPNDIVADGRKLCGILCELTEKDGQYYAICGIGINVETAPQGEGITAIALKELYAEASAAEFTERLLNKLENINITKVICKYKKYCLTIAKEVKIISPDGEYEAKATDVAENGNLIIEKNGEKISINSGEVSVRGIYGYC